MADEHIATGNPITEELVKTVVAFIEERRWYTCNQAAGVASDKSSAAEFALNELAAEMRDHLQIDLAVALASLGIGWNGDARRG